ncbi:hypothetical protein [Nocardia nova]|nr:hypothetical protein [Nocardia nova]MBF6149575.1 hypothetical protein [Nocardia nova]
MWPWASRLAARGGLLGRERWSAFRLLFLAVPLSLGLAVLLGSWLFPGQS